MHKGSRVQLSLAVNLSLLTAFTGGTALAQSPDTVVESIVSSLQFAEAVDFLRADHDRFVEDLIALTEIPAPPFMEGERAEAYLRMLQAHGLADVSMDAEGNVMGVRKGSGSGSVLAVLAHLDTVFPEGTDVQVRREDTRLFAPGVADDTRGLAMILATIRALDHADIETQSDILFVGNVGEEGVGDLRGTKYLLMEGPYRDQIDQFVTIDGPGDIEGQWSILNAGVGSIRYRVTFRGPGGHSFGNFGLVNPAYAMANAMTSLAAISVPDAPKTTHNVGVVSGGTSVNSIPVEVSMEVDMRSESSSELHRLHELFLASIHEAVEAENARGSTEEGIIEVSPVLIGSRPVGATPENSRIAQVAAAAIEAFGLMPIFRSSSTDANIPMSLGIPAIGLVPGQGWRAHSLEEWTDVDLELTLQAESIVLATLLGLAGVAD